MFVKYVSSALVALLLNLLCYSTATAANADRDAQLAEKIKTEIARFGADNGIKIAIKLKDGTKIEGYVSAIKDFGFIVRNLKTGTESELSYSQIRRVKQYKSNRNSAAIVALKVVLVFGLLGILGGGLSDDF